MPSFSNKETPIFPKLALLTIVVVVGIKLGSVVSSNVTRKVNIKFLILASVP